MRISEKAFLVPMFRSLEENGIAYAVLRNAATLPETMGGSDIDIQIAMGKMADVTSCLEEVASRCGGRIMAKIDSPHFRQLQLCGCLDGKWWGCCLDLFEGVFCQSVLPIADDALLDKRIRNPFGVWTLDDDRGAYLGFVKELLTNGVYSKRYEDGAKRAVAVGRDDFLLSESLRVFAGKALVGDAGSANVFRKTWLFSMAIRHPVFFWRNWLGFLFSRFKRIFRPAGRMIAVMGTDGAGKTTIIEGIIPVLKLMNHGNTIVHHLKPDLLPSLGRLRGIKYEPGHVCTNPHGSKPSGFVGSIARIAYLMCDYVLGYWIRIRPKLAKVPAKIWISDRYAYDLLIDPRRFRIALPVWIIKCFVFFAPHPDLLICLGGEPEKIYARKPETSLDEVERQVAVLKHFCHSCRRAVWVDTTGSIDSTIESVLHNIIKTR